MDVESRIRGVLQRQGDAVQPDVPAALDVIRREARLRTARQRAYVAAGALALAAGVAVVVRVVGVDAITGRADPAPAHDPEIPEVTLSIVQQRSAAELGLDQALNVAVGAHGRVYVTDTSQHVTELTPDLRPVRSWGGNGTAPGKFRLIQGSLAVGPGGHVYVSDTGNFRIQEFTPAGRFIGQVGSFGSGPGQFTWPFDLAVDPAGNLYVADDKAETLTKLTPSGDQVWRHGGLDVETDPRLLGHQHLAGFDPSGHLLTVNDDAGSVLLWDASGDVIGSFGSEAPSPLGAPDVSTGRGLFPQGACDATSDSQGLVYVTGCDEATDANWSGVFLEDGTPVGSWVDSPLSNSPRWGADGRGYAVTTSGGVAEVQTTAR
jgi:hypothetical protein